MPNNWVMLNFFFVEIISGSLYLTIKFFPGDGKNKLHPLQPGQTVFFSLQPRYTNVDMRVIVDVTKGSLDLYLAPSEDVMVVKINASNGEHSIDYDRPLYHLLPNPMNEDTLNFDISSSRGNSFTISLNDSYGPITPSKVIKLCL